MSVTATKWAYAQRTGSAARKGVLASLAEQADEETFTCYPGQGLIAERTELGERTVRRELAWLAAQGYIRREPRFNKSGHRTSDWYVINVGAALGTDSPPATATTGHGGRRSHGPRPPATQAATTGHGGQVTVREPSVEPSVSGRAKRDPAPKGDNAAKTDGTRGTRLSTDWAPSAADVAWQRGEGISDDWAQRETENFRDYWLSKAGAAARKIDWSRTWKKWIRTEFDRTLARMPRSVGAPQPMMSERRPTW